MFRKVGLGAETHSGIMTLVSGFLGINIMRHAQSMLADNSQAFVN